MSTPTLAEVRVFAGNFQPKGWLFCHGQYLTIENNQALFSLIGTTYGGDGRETFQLPDFRGRFPMCTGTDDDFSDRAAGDTPGEEDKIFTIDEMPAHTHTVTVTSVDVQIPISTSVADENSPNETYLTQQSSNFYGSDATVGQYINATADLEASLGDTGGSDPTNNMSPFTCLNFIICVEGLYPQRN
ncbi:MAG: tail fiber protein [Bacteroidota bacterium]